MAIVVGTRRIVDYQKTGKKMWMVGNKQWILSNPFMHIVVVDAKLRRGDDELNILTRQCLYQVFSYLDVSASSQVPSSST